MDCKDVREFVSDLETDNLSLEVLDHVTRCSGCKVYLGNARLVKPAFEPWLRRPCQRPPWGLLHEWSGGWKNGEGSHLEVNSSRPSADASFMPHLLWCWCCSLLS